MKNKSAVTRKTPTLTNAEALAIAELCGGDGHSIVSPELFADRVNAAFLEANTRTYKSDGSWKGSIDGDPNKSVHGIYTLDILRRTASVLGISYRPAMGRGTEARNITAAILEACK